MGRAMRPRNVALSEPPVCGRRASGTLGKETSASIMKWSYVIALLLALGAAGWIASGQFAEGDGLPAGPESRRPNLTNSRADALGSGARRSRQSSAPSKSCLRGRTEAVRKVDVKAETYGRIIALHRASAATAVEEGQVIAKLSLDDREARLQEATPPSWSSAASSTAPPRNFRARAFAPTPRWPPPSAALEAAEAAVALAEANLDNTIIRAPFDGLIDERQADIGDYPGDRRTRWPWWSILDPGPGGGQCRRKGGRPAGAPASGALRASAPARRWRARSVSSPASPIPRPGPSASSSRWPTPTG